MNATTLKKLLVSGVVGLLLGWIALMVSFWLPTDFAQSALSSTALCLLIPSAVVTGVITAAWNELQDVSFSTKQPKMRCIDCGNKILTAAGATVGDEIEGEIMLADPVRHSPGSWAAFKQHHD
jgi:hypothetical protein